MVLRSRKSPVTDLDNISISLLTNKSTGSNEIYLDIFNSLWRQCIVPDAWLYFHVIPISKLNTSPVAYRLIALSSISCKRIEYMIKNHLVWYLENNRCITDNLFGFHKGLGMLDYLSAFTKNIYQFLYEKIIFCCFHRY